jgi:hypothetical protein
MLSPQRERGMGSEPENEPSSAPKLSLFSLPSKPQPPPGILLTPPPCGTTASVPFQWEEAPGKPRACTTTTESKPRSARPLELPPRLLFEIKTTDQLHSPTTVLDGPYLGPSLSHRFSSFTSSEAGLGKRVAKEKGLEFASMRWGSFRKTKNVLEATFDFASSVVGGGGGGGGGGDTTVKITRVRRRGSWMRLSHSKSHFLVSSKPNGFNHPFYSIFLE